MATKKKSTKKVAKKSVVKKAVKKTVKKTVKKIAKKSTEKTASVSPRKLDKTGIEIGVLYDNAFFLLAQFRDKYNYQGSVKGIPEKFKRAHVVELERGKYIDSQNKEAFAAQLASSAAICLWDDYVCLDDVGESKVEELMKSVMMSSPNFTALCSEINDKLEQIRNCYKVIKRKH